MPKRKIEYSKRHNYSFVPPNQRHDALWNVRTQRKRGEHDYQDSSETPAKKSRFNCDSSVVNGSQDIIHEKSKIKWKQLQHNGPCLPPPYERLPAHIHFLYNGKPMELSQAAEEVATHYAKVLKTDFSQKPLFQRNYFKNFKEAMTDLERNRITSFELCNFANIHNYFQQLSKTKKIPTPEIKYLVKLSKDREIGKFAFCVVDGIKEKIANYHVEVPGLFRGRGEHPKMGMVKQHIRTEDITINCSIDRNSIASEEQRWKSVINDQYVSWLASWYDPLLHITKYIKLSPASRMRRSNDMEKFEVARRLGDHIDDIRAGYRKDWLSPNALVRQRAVALYLIDKLALRVGCEKNQDQPDTVGCCSLRVEHITLDPLQPIIKLQFQGKDSIWYKKSDTIENGAFKNLKRFVQNKSKKDLLFDKLTAPRLTSYLKSLMHNLTSKVFRTYHSSVTLQNQLDLRTANCYTLKQKLEAYKEANRKVAILCNHQRTPPKNCAKSLDLFTKKIDSIYKQLHSHYSSCSLLNKCSTNAKRNHLLRKCRTAKRLRNQLTELKLKRSYLEENSTIALGTSKLNYIDPRITVAWCKKHNVPISKIFNRSMMEKFEWALERTQPTFRF